MDLTAPGTRVAVNARARAGTRGWPPAAAVLLGALMSMFGLSWDVQWHSDVGPDTFFTLPHLLLYTGSAVAGVAALVVVLRTTAAQRAGRSVDPAVGGHAIGVFGRTFAAPVAYLVTGTAAATFLLYGLWDQWWHSLYGFDATIDSPPHIGLLLAISTTIIGSLMAFAAARAERWGRIGVLVSLALLVAFFTITSLAFQDADGAFDAVDTSIAFTTVLLLVVAVSYFRRPGAALLAGGAVAALQAVLWVFTPWATYTYADAVGLPVRDYVDRVPGLPSLIPMSLLGVALLLEGALRVARASGWSARVVAPLCGAVATALVAALAPLQRTLLFDAPLPEFGYVAPTAIVALVLGALAGLLGWRFGLTLRAIAPTTAEEA
ncbi:hypothetical protein [Umezawaea beigongshangensis]|uniref:hypothetical protein n=1 Tax=Umezawaea beigongshangensis TaxID=2780383 RepID=UPI0018F216E6|nr:hypothetical protein [Umezawaea beigongshangensis]